jgi:hypothetical protein
MALAGAGAAGAEPGGPELERGRALLADGEVAAACRAFAASQRLAPTPQTQVALASCEEQDRHLVTAWRSFREAAAATADAEAGPLRRFHDAAAARAARLEPRLSTLRIRVPPSARLDGLELLRDGAPLPEASWDQPIPLDRGTYAVMVRAPGHPAWSTTVTVAAEGDHQVVEVPWLVAPEEVSVVSAPAAPAAAGPAAPEAPAPPLTLEVPRRVPGLTFALASGAWMALGTAVVLELWSEATYAESQATKDGTRQAELWSAADDRRYAAATLAVVGVGCAGAALWIYLRRDHDEAGIVAVPTASPDGAGVMLRGRW